MTTATTEPTPTPSTLTARLIATFGQWTIEHDAGDLEVLGYEAGYEWHVLDGDGETYDSYMTETEALNAARELMVDDLREEAIGLVAELDDEATIRRVLAMLGAKAGK